MRQEKFDRRAFMLKKYGESLSLKEAVEYTAAKFGCKKQSLYTDWARRDKWLNKVCNFQDADTQIRGLVTSFSSILEELNDLIENADNSNCKLGALRLSTKTRFRIIELLKDLKRKEKLEISSEELDRLYPSPIDNVVRKRLGL